MKTATKGQIVEFIIKNGPSRPSALALSLGISLQALHRHLNDLIEGQVLERRGRTPFTTYVRAGMPDFDKALQWYQSLKQPGSQEEVCETSDVFTGRLPRLKTFENQGLRTEDLPLVISATGEIGNNSFDHNLGQWRDVPGCWFETQQTSRRLWILIADRGQGIYRSLVRAHPEIPNEQIAIERAFNEMISGRAPEQRGNGLKYVKNIVLKLENTGLACRSGNSTIHFGDFGEECSKVLKLIKSKSVGTITLIAWNLNEDRN